MSTEREAHDDQVLLRARLVGPEVELGKVAARDLAQFLLRTERILRRMSGIIVGRRVKTTGRREGIIEEATRLRLMGLEEGSLVAVLAPPEMEPNPEALDLEDAQLGEMAIEATIEAITGDNETPPEIAAALVDLAEAVGVGSRVEAVEYEAVGRAPSPRRARLDPEAVVRLRSVAARAAVARRDDRVVGVLYEADFEARTAGLRTGRARVDVTFDESLADDIKRALRERAELVGEITYDPDTSMATAVELRELRSEEQLAIGLDSGDFWDDEGVEDRAARLGVGIPEPDDVRDDDATDDEVDGFLAALGL